MKTTIDGLESLFLKQEVIVHADYDYPVLIFMLGCMLMGLIVAICDLFVYLFFKKSILKVEHGLKNTLLLLLFWPVGAFFIGFLGIALKVFLISIGACVLVGLSWPFIFAKFAEKAGKEAIKNDPEPEQQ
ncbi:hypothetical protein HJP15_19000 [Pseudoalteromonas sp. NEC-BIFX-2020_002]|uniref:hypothetical protein n=1 Tax=Pseudoalteromonas sp. NEC-BIFX-2020_002 TaxID=2732353 RepID=UPI001476F6E6|nr:hypothetical protein [Pseudoalteromonas sp. NEC-BIFX-2020_002]NNG44980.1 hypothetical protein [Pseudoalteromonas sp. NEC-BIFX-2020_002]